MQTNKFKQNFPNNFPSSNYPTNFTNPSNPSNASNPQTSNPNQRPFKKTIYKPLNTTMSNHSKNPNEKFLLTSKSKLAELLETQNSIYQKETSINKSNTIINTNSNTNLINQKEKEKEIFLINHKIILDPFRYYEDSKFSTKSFGKIISYGVNTNQGQIRNYNEDRVSIILNVIKPSSRKNEDWPKVSFFGIFDGHGGSKCSDFLKENLHHYVWM